MIYKFIKYFLLFFFFGESLASQSIMINSGKLRKIENWSVNPHRVDTLVIPFGLFAEFGSDGNDTLTNITNISIYGTLTPSWTQSIWYKEGGSYYHPNYQPISSRHLILNTNASIDIKEGGKLENSFGNDIHTKGKKVDSSSGQVDFVFMNNSTHSISFGTECIWGNRCCDGNNTIIGPSSITIENPCGFIVLETKKNNSKLHQNSKKIDGYIKNKNGKISIYSEGSESLLIRLINPYNGRVVDKYYNSDYCEFTISDIVYILVIDNNGKILEGKFFSF